jgi:hypothetical protein
MIFRCDIARRERRAFSVIELIMSMGVLGLVFVSVYAGLSWGFVNVQLARENLRATQVALEKMETMRMYSWEQVNSNGYVPTNFTATFFPNVQTNSESGNLASQGVTYYGTTVITNMDLPVAYSNNVRRVIVSVLWTNNHVPRSRQMETLISQYGMQRYVY